MKINRKNLIEMLEDVKPAVASKEILDQSTHFVFQDGELRTFNDKVSINCECEEMEENFAVQADTFFKLLKSLTGETIEMKLIKSKLKIKDKKTKATLQVEESIELPDVELPDRNNWLNLPDDFSEALKFCMFSVGKNGGKPALTCLYMDGAEIQSCDNHRLTVWSIAGDFCFNDSFLLPSEAARQLISYDPIEYCVDDTWVHFQNDAGVIFSCRKVALEFPDLKHLLDVEGEEVKLPETLKPAIEKAGILTESSFDAERFITLNFNNGKLVVKGEGKIGWLEESLEVNSDMELTVKVHPDHFLDILNKLDTAIISDSAILFEGKPFKHVVALVE